MVGSPPNFVKGQAEEGSVVPEGESLDISCDSDSGFFPPFGMPIEAQSLVCRGAQEGFSQRVLECFSTAICQEGEWSPLDFKCARSCSPFPVEELEERGAQVKAVSAEELKSSPLLYAHGAVVTMSCPSGMAGMRGEAGQAVKCFDGKWEERTLHCTGRHAEMCFEK
uniref:Sushi domain-containing protein n=1 Tax=Chromera velia CCMP2878 TaxID=1169474 RepID=A0A0G4I2Q8_9ALVE|eukprot:Cvel_35139.t1-p1 / transcript=Cvel_35139.t1 / gene=Cvel_35139 / organism=Chromera_velia_CCMP2878 / gene_product=hypothetical protein / transcript_product=hypothetical protein / location=Cvel_scaffold6308:475-2427(-) / protein_length=166 / sequence_SO=supercontig / SO=protein_coding / is_pseudo=false